MFKFALCRVKPDASVGFVASSYQYQSCSWKIHHCKASLTNLCEVLSWYTCHMLHVVLNKTFVCRVEKRLDGPGKLCGWQCTCVTDLVPMHVYWGPGAVPVRQYDTVMCSGNLGLNSEK